MKRFLLLAVSTVLTVLSTTAAVPQRKALIDDAWQFRVDGATEWRTVDLPHDWSAESEATKNAPSGVPGGYRQTGLGWYEKTLNLGREYAGKKLRLYFEGVYMNSEVYVNDSLAGGHPYGYTSFFVDITPYIRIGKNTIRVKVDNSQQINCRWYSGSGIYRHVWLLTTPKQYIDEWSVEVTTPDTHTVNIKAEVVGEDGSRKPINKTLKIDQPRLWSPDDPFLYHTTIETDGDVLPVTYGLRTIEYSAEKGLLLNGKSIKLNGACVHHDNGVLGAASPDEAEYRKVRLLKEGGFNAVRTSHNPPSEAFLRACDELGLLVIDEAFDGWRDKKNDHDYHKLIDKWWQDDLGSLVRRDRCHPSIFCWSTGNEVIERKHIGFIKTARQMAELNRQLDPERRPVTSALAAWDRDWDIYDPLAAEHDIVGYNYMIFKAESDHERVPSRVMMQTESYPRDAYRNYRTTMDHQYIIGDFVWTGIDYLGESGLGRYYYEGEPAGESWQNPMFPANASYCGDIDFTGWRKPISHYRSMLWNGDGEQLYMAVREPDTYYGQVKTTMWGTWPTWESWTWPGWEGKNIEVEVYSRQPQVKLYLDEQLIGEQTTKEMKATFTLPYKAGTLRAEAGGKTVMLSTAGEPASLRLTADCPSVGNGRKGNVTFVTVEVVDAQGRPCPNADQLLRFAVKGKGRLLGMGNGDVKDTAAFVASERKTWKGRALCVVKGHGRLIVTADGLKTAAIAF